MSELINSVHSISLSPGLKEIGDEGVKGESRSGETSNSLPAMKTTEEAGSGEQNQPNDRSGGGFSYMEAARGREKERGGRGDGRGRGRGSGAETGGIKDGDIRKWVDVKQQENFENSDLGGQHHGRGRAGGGRSKKFAKEGQEEIATSEGGEHPRSTMMQDPRSEEVTREQGKGRDGRGGGRGEGRGRGRGREGGRRGGRGGGGERKEPQFVECPHCGGLVQILSVRCGVFRHGVFKDTGRQLKPHETQARCESFVARGIIEGCGKPFQISKEDGSVSVCDYI